MGEAAGSVDPDVALADVRVQVLLEAVPVDVGVCEVSGAT